MKRNRKLLGELIFSIESDVDCKDGVIEWPERLYDIAADSMDSISGSRQHFVNRINRVIKYHLRLLVEDGYIREVVGPGDSYILTNKGHDLADLMRDGGFSAALNATETFEQFTTLLMHESDKKRGML